MITYFNRNGYVMDYFLYNGFTRTNLQIQLKQIILEK